MNELRRMAYLDALGVDSYVSRVQLPGAAATRRLAIVTAPNSQQLSAGVIPEPLLSRSALVAQTARPAKASVQAPSIAYPCTDAMMGFDNARTLSIIST